MTIDASGQGRRLLVTAHRHSTVRQTDNIMVLDDGQVIERSAHEELVLADGLDRQPIQTQRLERDVLT